MKESDVISALAKSKASANRVAKSLESKMIKAAIGNLQTALKTLEAREAAKESKRRDANIKKLSAMMAKWVYPHPTCLGVNRRKPARKQRPRQNQKQPPKRKPALAKARRWHLNIR